MPRLAPRSVGLGAPQQVTLDKLAAMSPAQILAVIQSGGGIGLATADGVSLAKLQQAAQGKWLTDAQAKDSAAALQFFRTVGTIGGSAIGMPELGLAAGVFEQVGAGLTSQWNKLVGFHGPEPECKNGVAWTAQQYFSAAAAQGSATPPANGLPAAAALEPGSLAALIVPSLCQAYAKFEQCSQTGQAAIAIASNIFIASTVNAWNKGAVGLPVDYFVPYVPCNADAFTGWPNGWQDGGWQVWASNGWLGGESSSGSWQLPPPFVVPGQAQYAFRPLSEVPASVADPSTEFAPGQARAFTGGQPQTVDPLANSGPLQPGYQWSRIRANSGPFVTSAGKVVLAATITSAAVFGIGAAVAAVKGVSVAKVLTGWYNAARSAL